MIYNAIIIGAFFIKSVRSEEFKNPLKVLEDIVKNIKKTYKHKEIAEEISESVIKNVAMTSEYIKNRKSITTKPYKEKDYRHEKTIRLNSLYNSYKEKDQYKERITKDDFRFIKKIQKKIIKIRTKERFLNL